MKGKKQKMQNEKCKNQKSKVKNRVFLKWDVFLVPVKKQKLKVKSKKEVAFLFQGQAF